MAKRQGDRLKDQTHLQIGQAAALSMQLLDLIGIAYVAFIQRRLLGIVGCLQVLQIALMPKLHIAGVFVFRDLG